MAQPAVPRVDRRQRNPRSSAVHARNAFIVAHQQILAAIERPEFPRILRHEALEAAAALERFNRQFNAYLR